MSKSKEKASTTALAKSMSEAPIPELMKKIDGKIASLKRIEESVYKTPGTVPGFPTKIKEETNIGNLLKMGSALMAMEKAYDDFATQIGRKKYPNFLVCGHGFPEYKADIELRIEIIEHKDTLDKLKGFKDSMKGLMSAADQKAILAQEMAAFLADQPGGDTE